MIRRTTRVTAVVLGVVVAAATPAGANPPAPAETPPRGYTIPVVDLAAETHRQVVVDREPGQYLGHPTTVLLEDGRTMIAVYPKGHGRGAIVMKRSPDGGRTWSARLPVPESWATSQEVPTIHRVIDPGDGTRRLILFSGLHPIRMSVSEDDGLTWSPLAPIGDFGGIVTMASVERLRDGRYMALFHDDGRFLREGGARADGMWVYKTVSADGGLTWSPPAVIATRPGVHLCEPGVVRAPDGRQIAVLLRENSRRRNSFIIFSDDEGETWSEPRELPGALTGDRHTGRYAPDGRLFLSFRDTTHESATKGDWVGWVGTYDDLVHGREGQYRVRLMDNHHRADCAYPGVELLPDGTFVCTTYGHWTAGEQPYVVSVRFTLAEIEARARRHDADPVAATAGNDDDAGVLGFRILDGADGRFVPGRLTFVPEDGRGPDLFPGVDAAPEDLAVRGNVVYSLSGHGRITVPPGRYLVFASRGIEWSVAAVRLVIEAGAETGWSPILVREVATDGWISGDFHLHTLTYSGHGDSNLNERLISLVGEGVEFAVATDHNHHTDYGPTIDRLGVHDAVTAITGNEVSVPIGHFNAFPLDPARPPVDATLRDANVLFPLLRRETNAFGVVPVIQVNHPRWSGIDYFAIGGLDPVTGVAASPGYSDGFDTIEVLNENVAWGYYEPYVDGIETSVNLHSAVRDWFNLLNRGHRYAAVGNSDSHTVHYAFAGYPRNYVACAAASSGAIDPADVARALRARQVFTTTGPFVELTVNDTPMGGQTSARDGAAHLVVDVQAASWIDCDRVKVVVNGDVVETIAVPDRPRPPSEGHTARRLHTERRIALADDAWITVLVEGDRALAPIVDGGQRPVRPLAVANPVWVDVDGDGVWTSPAARVAAVVAGSATRAELATGGLEASRPSERGLAILAAATQARPYAADLVRDGLADEDRMVRLRAARAAERLADRALLASLEAALRTPGDDPYQRIALLRAIGVIDETRFTPALVAWLERDGTELPRRWLDELTPVLPGRFVTDWQVIGYFPAPEAGTVTRVVFGPEASADPAITYAGKAGAELRWRDAAASDAGFLDLHGLATDASLAENAGACAQTWLRAPDDRSVAITLGTDDGSCVYLNGTLVYEDSRRRSASPVEHVATWPLRAGWNRVVFKVENGGGGFGLYLRVLDDEVTASAHGPAPRP